MDINRSPLCVPSALLLAVILQTTAALAECETSVNVTSGETKPIGYTVDNEFVLDQKLNYGSLEVVTDGGKKILNYKAKPTAVDVREDVDCEISGEGKKIVAVSVQKQNPVGEEKKIVAPSVQKQNPGSAPETIYADVAKTLVLLFALAVLLESALAGVFRWRPFAEFLNARAVRPLVAFLLAWWFVRHFDLDLVTALVNGSAQQAPKGVNNGGQILTALVLAGGSSGVNAILVALGFRQVSTPQTQPKPPPNKAWIAVRAMRKPTTKGSIDVLMGPMITLADGTTKEPPFVGTIVGRSGIGFLSFFMRDRGRFPGYGGHEVDPAQEVYVVLRGPPGTNRPEASWGPHRPAAGAIIDLDLEI